MAVGNLEFIKSASGTSVSSLSVTDCFSANYDVYKVVISEYKGTANSYLFARLLDSTNTVITANEYDDAYLGMTSYGTFAESRTTNDSRLENFGYYYSGTVSSTAGFVTVYNPFDSGSYTFTAGQSSAHLNTIGGVGYKSIGVHKSTEQINGINFFPSAGSIDFMEINVFGVK